ncbi:hypothetical protein F4778DRAFT_761259 [Xylariomycetidae sp. FL2044]|nr:hypothetical protein F4778DRAFT_761259 [Xylariomycetidae sp. FL2044]
MSITPHLDHVSILVSHSLLLSPPPSLTDRFTLTPISRPADGMTESRLVHFADGTYLEFIAFPPDSDPDARSEHRYGKCEEGTVADWAICFAPAESSSGPEAGNWEAVLAAMQLRVRDSGSGVIYLDAVEEHSVLADGNTQSCILSYPEHAGHFEWRIEYDMIPGEVPVWILHRDGGQQNAEGHSAAAGAATATRTWTDHACGVVGLANVGVRLRADRERTHSEHRFGLLWEAFQTLFSDEPMDIVDEGKQINAWAWPIGVPNESQLAQEVRLVSPKEMRKKIEISVGLHTKDAEIVDLRLLDSDGAFEISLPAQSDWDDDREGFHWEWMKGS